MKIHIIKTNIYIRKKNNELKRKNNLTAMKLWFINVNTVKSYKQYIKTAHTENCKININHDQENTQYIF